MSNSLVSFAECRALDRPCGCWKCYTMWLLCATSPPPASPALPAIPGSPINSCASKQRVDSGDDPTPTHRFLLMERSFCADTRAGMARAH